MYRAMARFCQSLRLVSIAGLFMVSAVARNVFHGFRRWFVYGFRRGKKRVSMVSALGFVWFPCSTALPVSQSWKPSKKQDVSKTS
jgi:hypothetical protein